MVVLAGDSLRRESSSAVNDSVVVESSAVFVVSLNSCPASKACDDVVVVRLVRLRILVVRVRDLNINVAI